jgi:integrase
MAEALTARGIDALRPRDTGPYEVFDGEVPGLALRVGARRKSWMLFYRHAGRLRRILLGHYPKLKLAEVRKKATAQRARVFNAHDPAEARAKARAEAESTVAKLIETYAKEPSVTAKRSWNEEWRVLDTDVLPVWGDRHLTSLSRADVRELVNRKAQTAPVMANRLLAHVSHLFNYALDLDLIDANPAARLKKLPVASRERVLTRDEVAALWRFCTKGDVPKDTTAPKWSPVMRDLFAVLLLTGQRLGEVTGMKWADVNLLTRWWTLPASETKNQRQHRVPLSKPAVAILKRHRPEHDGDVERQVYVFSTIPGTNIHARTKKAMAQLCAAFKWTDARAHDIRRTVATHLGEMGTAPHVISAILNHTDGSVTGVYNRFKYDAEKREALEKWAARLDQIAKGKPARRAGSGEQPRAEPAEAT